MDKWQKEPLRSTWEVIKAVVGSPMSVDSILKALTGNLHKCVNLAGEKLPCKVEVFQTKDCIGPPNETHISYCLGDGEKVFDKKAKHPWMSARVSGWCGKVVAMTAFADPELSLGDMNLFSAYVSQLEHRDTWEHYGPPCPKGFVPDFYEGLRCISTQCKTFRWDLDGSGVKGFVIAGTKAATCAEVTCPEHFFPKNMGMHYCRNSTCTTDECCGVRQCISYPCPAGTTSVGDQVFCKHDPCTQAECCRNR